MTQEKLIAAYFKKHPCKDIPHAEVVDWATAEWETRTGKKFRDPDRSIRKLHQAGFLVKVKKGVYRYDPEAVVEQKLEDFTAEQKKQILKRDGYKCAVCGVGRNAGVELHVDHIKSKDRGGKAELSNGQVLCATHNFRKKNYSQTESGKKMFINLLNTAKSIGDEEMIAFCENILKTYENHDINGHIKWGGADLKDEE